MVSHTQTNNEFVNARVLLPSFSCENATSLKSEAEVTFVPFITNKPKQHTFVNIDKLHCFDLHSNGSTLCVEPFFFIRFSPIRARRKVLRDIA